MSFWTAFFAAKKQKSRKLYIKNGHFYGGERKMYYLTGKLISRTITLASS
jgi:hypothetical protein